ncbi:aspartate carbamoyltransferase [Streptomyces sp. NPDC101150]|uniref:aspartate/ornithine carbamoyltransferase family protein n=1 Tax=Streptomyces sp. NPDC101150 TaxID=3366114 RepID=UPI0037F644E6
MVVTAAAPAATALHGRHLLSMQQFQRRDLENLFTKAEALRIAAEQGALHAQLAGRVLVSAFFDASTRTRLAHETAMLRLGGAVTGFADPEVTRAGGTTQESLYDVFRMLSEYGDVIVVRHPETGVAAMAAHAAGGRAAVINGGDGTGEHPTQTLTDLYSIWRRFGKIDGLRIGVVNDLRMRCTRSLLRGLRDFDCTVYAVAAPGKELDAQLREECTQRGQRVEVCEDLREMLSRVDAVYSSPTILDEVSDLSPTDGVLRGDTPLTASLLGQHGQPDLAVFHPLPRKGEIDRSLDSTPFNGYWEQAHNGVPIRMALLSLMLEGR